jgi:hypothetical protein
VRLKTLAVAAVLAFLAAVSGPQRARAQNPETMMPEASEAKAKQLLQQLIQALGGPAYLHVRESLCTGRVANFDRNGNSSDPFRFKDFWRYPDKNRTEYDFKGNIRALTLLMGGLPVKGDRFVQVHAGDQGWSLDKGGVSEMPSGFITDFKEQVRRDMDNLLRLRLDEKGLIFRYGGSGLEDLKEVDWVVIEDADQRTIRLAMAKKTHLPLRSAVSTRDETNRVTTEEVTIYANFHLLDGIQQPMQVERQRDGRRVFQAFYESCEYNPNLSDDLFTRASLDRQWAQSGKKIKDQDHNKNTGNDKN